MPAFTTVVKGWFLMKVTSTVYVKGYEQLSSSFERMPVIEQCVHVHDKKDGFTANLIFKDITTVCLDMTLLKRAYPSIIANIFGKLKNDNVNGKMTYPMVMAPYISIDSAKQCEQLNMGYMDMSGNCRILIGSLYVSEKGHINKFSRNV